MWVVPSHGLDPALNEMKKELSCQGGQEPGAVRLSKPFFFEVVFARVPY